MIHNLNTMHSRAGAQMPFSSINYGMDTSPEGRMVIKNILLATEAGPGQRGDAHLPHPDLPGEGGRQLQPRRAQLRPVQAGHAAAQRQAALPQLLLYGRPLQPAILQGRPSRRRRSPTWAAAPGSSATSTTPTARSANGRGNLSFTSINLPRHGHQGQGQHGLLLRGAGPDDGPGASTSCWSGSRSSAERRCAISPS